MKYFIYLFLLLSSAVLSQQNELYDAAATNAQIAPQIHFTKPVESKKLLLSTKVPIEDSGSTYFVVKALVNGKGPYQFLIDTGTSFSIFSKKIASELNLQHIKNVPFIVNGQEQNVDFFRVNELALGEAKLLNYDVAVFEEPSLIHHFREEKSIGIEGILGFGAFNEYILTLDFSKMQIVLESNELNIADKNTLPYVHTRLVPMIPVFFKDKEKNNQTKAINFVIDSGFSGGLFMPAIAAKMPFNVQQEKRKNVITTLGKFEVVEKIIDAYAYFANQQIEFPELMYGDHVYGKTATYGLMGLKIINEFRISFDQKNDLIKIEKNDVQSSNVKEKPKVP